MYFVINMSIKQYKRGWREIAAPCTTMSAQVSDAFFCWGAGGGNALSDVVDQRNIIYNRFSFLHPSGWVAHCD